MNGDLLQDLAAGLLAAGALGWLVWRRLRARASGEACENCPAAAPRPAGVRPAPEPTLLVGIGEPPHDPPRPR